MGIIDTDSIKPLCNDFHLFLGDVTSINSDAVTCPVNENLHGLPYPCPNTLDNSLHLFAGEQIKQELKEILAQQQEPLHIGQAFITDGYNLPAKKIINVIVPRFKKELTPDFKSELVQSTTAALACADKHDIRTLALAKFHLHKSRVQSQEMAKVIIKAAIDYKKATKSHLKIYFSLASPSTLDYFSSFIRTESNFIN